MGGSAVLTHPQLIEFIGVCVLRLEHGCELNLYAVKKIICTFSLKFSQGTCPWIAIDWNYFGIFFFFSKKKKIEGGGSVGHIIYKVHVVLQGSSSHLLCVNYHALLGRALKTSSSS